MSEHKCWECDVTWFGHLSEWSTFVNPGKFVGFLFSGQISKLAHSSHFAIDLLLLDLWRQKVCLELDFKTSCQLACLKCLNLYTCRTYNLHTSYWVNIELPHIFCWLWWPDRGRMVVMSEVDKIWSAMAPNARPSVPDCHLTNPDFNPNWPFLSPWFCPRIWPPGQAYQSQPTPCIVTFNKDFMTLDVLSCCLALTDLDAKWVVNSHSGATLVFNISFVLALLYFTLLTHNWQTVILVFIHRKSHE